MVPSALRPMLVTLAHKPFSHADWLYEVKWDGMRALAYLDNGQVRIASRRGRCVTEQYPELACLPDAVDAQQAVIDGEIVAVDQDGVNFDRLMSRMRLENGHRVHWASRQTPVCFVAFDLLYVEGRDLRQEALTVRKRLLREVLQPAEYVAYSDHIESDGEAFYRAVCERGIEGVVAKRKDAPYISSGRRTRYWLKWKRPGWHRDWGW